jgi:hypothetical protein
MSHIEVVQRRAGFSTRKSYANFEAGCGNG